MGQSVTSMKDVREDCGTEDHHEQCNEPKEGDLKFLLGKMENLPHSARKLFSLGKNYLTTGSSAENEASDGFSNLFQVYQPCQTEEETSDTLQIQRETSKIDKGFLSSPLRKSAPLYHFQTYVQWKAAQDLSNFYSMCLPKRQTIYLQPINTFPEFVNSFRMENGNLRLNLFESLQAFLQVFFCGLDVLIRHPVTSEQGREEVRTRVHPVTKTEQICLTDLYPFLQRLLPHDGVCIIGISWTDVYPEGHNFALGEASPQHRAAVISFGRCEPKRFDATTYRDLAEMDATLLWKLLKSSSHELCHVLGLQHCSFFHCAMNESTSVDEALAQPLFLCPVCLRKLQQACGFDVLERYTLLHKFLSSLARQLVDANRLQECLRWLEKCIAYLNS